ncbi:MAG: hypothetical protein M0R46_09720 [Candidatus Muirbacterium halophilum]|nr:hypothetical protein [Candidatus Muirbacterium halophilum]MCK9476187.1 hypothetical protein [Candidatus Muirbacterium halophilum]
MIVKIKDILELDDVFIKSALAYISPSMLSEIIESLNSPDEEPIKKKIISNLSKETGKKIQLHNRSFDDTINKEELINNFITIINRVLNFR